MDRITLRGVRAYGRHGANPGERDRVQLFEIDVAIEVDLHNAQASDDLSDTVDYAALRDRLVGIVADTSYQLMERLAGDLLEVVFADSRVARAEVTIAKPGILDGATPSVTLVRFLDSARDDVREVGKHRAYVGIGANLGDAVRSVERASSELEAFGRVVRRSSLYRTEPWGKTDQPEFINAVVLLETVHEPHALLEGLKAIEMRLGRVAGERWGPRAIDLDLLAYDDREIDEPGLRVPHVHLRDRAFVLVPLAEIDPAYESLRDELTPEQLAGVVRI